MFGCIIYDPWAVFGADGYQVSNDHIDRKFCEQHDLF